MFKTNNYAPKVLQLNVCANLGSTGIIAENIGRAAISNGWDSYIAYRRYFSPSQSKLIMVGSKYGKYTHWLGSFLFDREGLYSNKETYFLVERIKRIQPDIVHLHNIHDHWLNYKILFDYLNTTTIKVVWTFHDFWAVTGHCMHFVSCGCSRYMTACHECPMQKVYPKSLIDRSRGNYELKKKLFSANKSLTIVPVSEWVGENVRKSFLKEKRIVVIPNGVDTSVFKPTSLVSLLDSNIKSIINEWIGKFVIMSVASQWKFDKGLDDYKAMARMLKKDEIIVLVGVDDSINSQLPSNIVGIRRTTNQKELAALYTRADVVTVFSSAETFGLTVVEGFACGTPAVVYNNTAPPTLITSSTGFVVDNHNYREAYMAIQKIRKVGRQMFSGACISHAKEHFDKDKCFDKYIQLYNDLLTD